MADNLKAIGQLDLGTILTSMVNFQNSRGKIKMVEVATTTTDYFDSANMNISVEDIIKLLVEVDSEGDLALRVGRHSVTGSTKLPNGSLDMEQTLRSCIGKTSGGKPYLRLVFQALT